MQRSDTHVRPPMTIFTMVSMIMAVTANLITEYTMMDERVKASKTVD